MYYTYKIVNTVNDKIYFGVTNNPKRRWQNHKSRSKTNKYNSALYNAMQLYGLENFSMIIIQEYETKDEAYNQEVILIEEGNTISPNGYNIDAGGRGGSTFRSEETREKLRQLQTGKTHTEESKQKMSESRRGENNHMYGNTHTEEARRKISETHKGKPKPPPSPEALENMSRAQKNRERTDRDREGAIRRGLAQRGKKKSKPVTQETRDKLRDAFIGKPRPQETCPHCGKVGGVGAMRQWHFDKCRFKELIEENTPNKLDE